MFQVAQVTGSQVMESFLFTVIAIILAASNKLLEKMEKAELLWF